MSYVLTISACTLTLDTDPLGAGCPSGTEPCEGRCLTLQEARAAGCHCPDELEMSGTCQPFTRCGEDEYESRAPTDQSDRECLALSNCEPGEYVEAPSTAVSDRQCARCPPGTYSAEMNAGQCQPWTSCQEGEHEVEAPTNTSDRACEGCEGGSFPHPSEPRCVDPSREQTSVIELRAPLVDDFALLSVNGVMHPVGYWGQADGSTWRDVSHWFRGGKNEVRLFGINTGGPQNLDVELRVDGESVIDVNCALDACASRLDGGFFVDRKQRLDGLVLPPERTVRVTAPANGYVYLDDQYTGLTTPAELRLPAGQYRLGVGVANDVPEAYEGAYYEQLLAVANEDVELQLGSERLVNAASTVKIAVLPVRRARALDTGGVAVLSDAEVARFQGQLQATSRAWLEPFSFGLSRWEVTVLPVEEELEMVSDTFNAFPDHACDLLGAPKYLALPASYDIVLVYFSSYDSKQQRYIGRGDPGMSYRCGQIQSQWALAVPEDSPSNTIFHNVLYAYGAHQESRRGLYSGMGGASGGSIHGYRFASASGETEWLDWYRHFIRGQVGETIEQRLTTQLSGPPEQPDVFAGPFASTRHGLWLSSESTIRP